jgi:hypothetical protein
MTARYEPVGAESESESEPGSHGSVLRNKLGIVTAQDMELAESQALWLAQKEAIEIYAADHRFTAEDVCIDSIAQQNCFLFFHWTYPLRLLLAHERF